MAVTGKAANWYQRVLAKAGNATKELTPSSGKVVISYLDINSVRQHWTGTAWTTTRTELTCALAGTTSYYNFTPSTELEGYTLNYEGWINGDKATTDTFQERVDPVTIKQGASVKA